MTNDYLSIKRSEGNFKQVVLYFQVDFFQITKIFREIKYAMNTIEI